MAPSFDKVDILIAEEGGIKLAATAGLTFPTLLLVVRARSGFDVGTNT